jgi:hypothetical protein
MKPWSPSLPVRVCSLKESPNKLGMVVGLIIRLSPGHLIREMLVSSIRVTSDTNVSVLQTYPLLQSPPPTHHS